MAYKEFLTPEQRQLLEFVQWLQKPENSLNKMTALYFALQAELVKKQTGEDITEELNKPPSSDIFELALQIGAMIEQLQKSLPKQEIPLTTFHSEPERAQDYF